MSTCASCPAVLDDDLAAKRWRWATRINPTTGERARIGQCSECTTLHIQAVNMETTPVMERVATIGMFGCALALVIALAMSVAGCLSSEPAEALTYTCKTSVTTCSATDARVCFVWCETVTINSDDPEGDVCDGSDPTCVAECEVAQ